MHVPSIQGVRVQSDDRLRPYVPGFVVDWLRDRPQVRHRSVDGTLAFVDVSGFTRLTERLAARGKAGAEEMSDLLDRTFDALLADAYSQGAWLVKWGGDAVLLLFQDEGHAARACTAAVAMRRTMDRVGRLQTSCGRVRLRVSTGVHSGRFDVFLVGGSHRELVITGPGATATALAEAAAAAGQVAVTTETAELLPPGCVRRRPDGQLLLTRSPGSPSRALRPAASTTGVDIGRCLPDTTRRHLLTGSDDAEHRLVSVAFVEFTGTDGLLQQQGPGATGAAVDAIVRTCQEACTRHGVSFWETDISKDGGKVMLVAGAPGSTGDEEDALLAVAREIVEAGGDLTVRVGVNSGRVFFGQFGPAYRRTLSVKGDAVNLAARLCAKAAPGTVLAAATTLGRARTPFATEALPPFRVKGKTDPVHACTVGPPVAPAADHGSDDVRLVGRDAELGQLHRLWDSVGGGSMQACTLVGEAGVGRSRLARELVRAVDGRVVQLRSDPWTATTAYVPVRRVLRELLGMADESPADAAGQALLALLPGLAPDLVAWAPLLGVVIGADVPPTTEVTALDERFRVRRQEEVTSDLLLRLLPGPALILVEDAHLLDPSSASLLETLRARAASSPWLLVRCLREDAPVAGPERLLLGPLGPGYALELLHLLTEEHPLAPHEAEGIVARSGGNPLFLAELASAAAHASLEELPTSVEGVVAARIDLLATDDRRLLRTAAVLGLDVDLELLGRLAEQVGVPMRPGSLERLSAFLVPTGTRTRRFRQAVVQATAYEGLPYSRRRALHGAVGDLLTDRGSDVELSLHFSRAGRHAQAWKHASAAAAHASTARAHAEAAVLYVRALDAARALDLGAQEAEAWEGLGDARFRLATFSEAAAAYGEARRRARSPLDTARLRHKAALCAERSGNYAQALSWSARARRAVEPMSGVPEASRLAAETLVVRATVRHWQGRHADAARDSGAAVRLATEADALDVAAEALVWLDVSELMLGRGDGAHVRQALDVLQELGNRPWQLGRCLNELGIRAWYADDWDGARQAYQQCHAAFTEAGDLWAAALAQANEAEILLEQGRLEQAEPLLRSALRAGRASAAPGHTAFVLGLLGRHEALRGRPAEALCQLAEARRLYEQIGEPQEVLATRLRTAECHLLAGAPDLALAELGGLPQGTSDPLLRRVRGLAATTLGDTEAGRADLEGAVTDARRRGADHDLVLALAALSRWHELTGRPVPAALPTEQAILRGRLGIAPGGSVELPSPRVRSSEGHPAGRGP